MREINEIIIHCSATHNNWREGQKAQTKVNEIRRWHVEDRGWSDIGYHFIIDRDGTVVKGRDLDRDGDVFEEVGAHVKGRNANSLGICLIGGATSSANDKFSDNYTPEQEKALVKLLSEIQSRFGEMKISGHNQYANKACPGFNVPDWLNGRHRPARSRVEKTSTFTAARLIEVATVTPPVLGAFSGVDNNKLLILGFFSLIILGAAFYIKKERAKKFQRGDV